MAKGPTVSTTFNAVDKISKPMKKIQSGIGKFAAIAGAAFVTGGIARGLQSFVREASKIEDAVAGFTPLLGGVEKANELVDMLNKTAATTPFQFENIAAAAKQLLPVMNQDLERTTATFRMLGDTAGGNAQKLESITRGFTKAMLKGKVDMESLNMIAEAGVPIYSELADSMGVSVEEMMKLSSAGKISSTDLEDAFKNMTKEGGIFFNGMAIASQTFTGKMSTLKDNIALTQAAIGKSLLPTLKPLVDRLIEAAGVMKAWVENNEELIQQNIEKAIKGITKAIKILVFLWEKGFVQAITAGIVAFQLITKAIWLYQNRLKIAAAAQAIFNAVMSANPIGLVIIGIAALIAITILLVKNWDKVKEALKTAWSWMVKVWDQTKALIIIFGGMAAPIVFIVEMIRSLINNFSEIKSAFQDGGFLSGIMAIGKALLEGVLEPLKSIWEMIVKVKDFIGTGLGKVAEFFGGGDSPRMSNQEARRGLVGRNDAAIQRTETTNNSTLDVNFNNAPDGTSYNRRGRAPNIRLNTGFGGGGL